MVELMLRGLEGDPRFKIFHVDARMSDDLEDVGGIRPQKLFRLIKCCMQALRIRWKHGPMDLYYVPAPAKKSAIVRDWVVMFLLRPWFSRLIFHWHAFGLGHWATGTTEFPSGDSGLALEPPQIFGKSGGAVEKLARLLTCRLLHHADISIVLTNYNKTDAALLAPKRSVVVPNGSPDPFAGDGFTPTVGGHKKGSPSHDERPPQFRALFLAQCTRDKGLFRAIDMIHEANACLEKEARDIRVTLTVAGAFVDEAERLAFEKILTDRPGEIFYAGFVGSEKKSILLAESDCLLFPTEYPGETFGLVVAEALLAGIPALVSPWRGIPEVAQVERIPWQATAGELVSLVDREVDCAMIREIAGKRFSCKAFHEGISKVLLTMSDGKEPEW